MQMKMFLTRLGEGSRMAITGDMTQIDLPSGTRSGLGDALDVLNRVQGVEVVRFGEDDVVRHAMVARIVGAYNARDKQRSAVSGEDMSGSAREAD
jgi:phosphate starvation-inducible PhoH-like protein